MSSRAHMGEGGRTPKLSVVVVGRNEGDRLRCCFASVRSMRYPLDKVELIYVDSGSSDASCRLAMAAGARVVELHPKRPTVALGRNAGWRVASAPFVLFVDGDTVIDPAFATCALVEFRDPRIAVVFGRTRELYPTASVFNRMHDLQWWAPSPGPAEYCIGTALMRRSSLQDVNGFNSDLMAGEEPEISARLRRQGYVVLCLDIPMAWHNLAMTRWSEYWWRLARRGYSVAEVTERHERKELPQFHGQALRSRLLGSLLVLLPVVAIVGTIVWQSWLPLVIAPVVFVLLVLNAARGARHRTTNWWSCLAFSLHTQLREIAELFGQLLYFRDKQTGRRIWIDYKAAPPRIRTVSGDDP